MAEAPLDTFIGEVTLLTQRRVFRNSQQYRIESSDRRGNLHGSYFPVEAAEFVLERLRNSKVDVEAIANVLEPHAEQLGLPYTYGRKLGFVAQDVAVALVAEGVASATKEGRKFTYAISSPPLPSLPLNEVSGERQAATNSLEELISQPESATLEFKSSAFYDYRQGIHDKHRIYDVLRTVAGFLNSQGGTLLIGVSDEGRVVGLERDYEWDKTKNRDKWMLALRNSIQDCIGGDIWSLIELHVEAVDGKDVCRIGVRPSPKPVYVKWKKEEQFFIRTANATQRLQVSAALGYVQQHFS